ncbi:MAG TPA: hypothetical protein VN878_01870, partial [Usitatibacter sp.]|nr:hypothetical protein [Usitatibacter sp.]
AGPLHDESVACLSGSLAKRGIVRPEFLHKILSEQERARRNHTGRIWNLLILEKWFMRYAPDFRLS